MREALGDRAGVAASYHQLGMIAQHRADYSQALDWYRKSLEIKEALGDRAGIAASYHQLGRIVQKRGDYDQALDLYRKSLEIEEAVGNRDGMAGSYHQLGVVAQLRGDNSETLNWYRKGLDVFRELGNRAGMATSFNQIGALLTQTSETESAIPFTLNSLIIRLQIGSPDVGKNVYLLSLQRDALGEPRFQQVLRQNLEEENVAVILKLLGKSKTQKNANTAHQRGNGAGGLGLAERLKRWFRVS